MGVEVDMMDAATEVSGHGMVPCAVSVCITPAAPSPVPIPYPVTASAGEGAMCPPMRTKMNGAKIITVGGGLKACHGNEPGTLKETLSFNTGGPCFLVAGAPNVITELGFTGITGSPGVENKGAAGGVRTAPVPNIPAPPGMCPGTLVDAAAFAAAMSSANGSGGNDGNGGGAGGGGKGGKGDGKSGKGCGAGGAGGCPVHKNDPSAGDPVDLATGRVFTTPVQDLHLPGPLPFAFVREYSSQACHRDVGLGHGWSHSLAYMARLRRTSIDVTTPEGKLVRFPKPTKTTGPTSMSVDGWVLYAEGDGFLLDTMDGLLRYLEPLEGASPSDFVLRAVRDANANSIQLIYERGLLVEVIDSVQRRILFRRNPQARIASIDVKNATSQARWISIVSYGYDEAGDLCAVTDADGYTTRFMYEQHRMVENRAPSSLAYSQTTAASYR